MYSKVATSVIHGIRALPVTVEAQAHTSGMPSFEIAGLSDATRQKTLARVRYAIESSGFAMPKGPVVVSISPSSLNESGASYDLPVAIAVLIASGQVSPDVAQDRAFAGALSLDGKVLPARGMSARMRAADDAGLTLTLPESLATLRVLSAKESWEWKPSYALSEPGRDEAERDGLDIAEVAGNDNAKHAMMAAAVGNLPLMLVGTPGSGKTMLARRMTTILPDVTDDEWGLMQTIHEVASQRPLTEKPFRAPHHSVAMAGLVGGGRPVYPGEVSLATGGVLFLDDFAEFSKATLMALRHPLEEGSVCLARTDGSYLLPASTQLIAASSPCACGHFGDGDRACTCSAQQVVDFRGRLDASMRIVSQNWLQADVRRVPFDEIVGNANTYTSADAKDAVTGARDFKADRMLYDKRHDIVRPEGALHVAARAFADLRMSYDVELHDYVSAASFMPAWARGESLEFLHALDQTSSRQRGGSHRHR